MPADSQERRGEKVSTPSSEDTGQRSEDTSQMPDDAAQMTEDINQMTIQSRNNLTIPAIHINPTDKLCRLDTVMSLDSGILARQIMMEQQNGRFLVKIGDQANIAEASDDDFSPVPEDSGDANLSANFFGRPIGNWKRTQSRWNPFRKQSGILGVIHAQSKRNRVVSKHGKLNTFRRPEEIPGDARYLKDFFTSMIELKWRWIFVYFAASFFISWLIFAGIWYIVLLAHGDFVHEEDRAPDHVVCVDNIKDFTSCFLFSMELQHTIGFGGRATTEQCAMAVIVQAWQSIIGVIIQACMAGIVFAKFTKPTNRAETIMFSKNALITMRNGSLYLLARVGDIRPHHLIGCQVYGQMVRHCSTKEGEAVPYHLQRMEFGTELNGSVDSFQMFWPVVIAHKIDNNSPLWDMSPRDILNRHFEIIITVEGTTPETSSSVQVRTSYLPSEILWGYRFEHTCVAYDKAVAKYAVAFSQLDQFQADRTPRQSAKDLEEKRKKQSVLTAFSDISRRTSCISAASSLHLDSAPARGYTSAAMQQQQQVQHEGEANGKVHHASI